MKLYFNGDEMSGGVANPGADLDGKIAIAGENFPNSGVKSRWGFETDVVKYYNTIHGSRSHDWKNLMTIELSYLL